MLRRDVQRTPSSRGFGLDRQSNEAAVLGPRPVVVAHPGMSEQLVRGQRPLPKRTLPGPSNRPDSTSICAWMPGALCIEEIRPNSSPPEAIARNLSRSGTGIMRLLLGGQASTGPSTSAVTTGRQGARSVLRHFVPVLERDVCRFGFAKLLARDGTQPTSTTSPITSHVPARAAPSAWLDPAAPGA